LTDIREVGAEALLRLGTEIPAAEENAPSKV
jgi:hypothetical protein